MYAVIKTGGKQYRVSPGDVIRVEKLPGSVGDDISFNDVLLIGGDDEPVVGSPTVEGASVSAKIMAQDRAQKIIVFKLKRRKGYRRKAGHRQPYTAVAIQDIQTAKKKTRKKAAKPAEESEE